MHRIASIIASRRLAMMVLVALVTAIAAIGASQVTFDDQPQHLFESDDAERETLRELFDSFGTDDRDCLVLIEAEHLGTPATFRLLRELRARVSEVDGVSSVRSVLDISTITFGATPRPLVSDAAFVDADAAATAFDELRSHNLVNGRLIASDGCAMIAVITLEPHVDRVDLIAPAVAAIRGAIAEARRAAPNADAVSVRLTGIPPLRADIIISLRRDQIRFLVLGALLGNIVAWLIFRRLLAVLVVTLAPIVGALWSMGIMGWAGEPVNVINAVMPTLVLVIGFTDSVHLMVDLRRSRAAGRTGLDAARDAIRHLGPACAMTSLTTAVGFGSLIVAKIGTIQRFGLVCAAGTVVTFVAVILITPLLASYLPTGRLVTLDRARAEHLGRSTPMRLLVPILNHPRIAVIIGSVITVGCAILALQLRPDNRIAETLPKNLETTQALSVIDERFGGLLQTSVMITLPDDLERSLARREAWELLDHVREAMALAPHTQNVTSIATLLQSADEARADPAHLVERSPLLAFLPADVTARLVADQPPRLAVRASVPDVGAVELERSFDMIELALDDLRTRYPGYAMELTGTTVMAARNVRDMIGDLARSLALAAGVIFVVMTIGFRSLRLGLISVVPNVFPLVVTGAILFALGQPLQITSVIVFTVCLGIAVDDTIHFIARYAREKQEPLDSAVDVTRIAVERAFVHVGAALLITTAVLLAGFGVVTLSQVPAMRLYAALSCIAIAAALIGDLFILPAMLQCFDRRPRDSQPMPGDPP